MDSVEDTEEKRQRFSTLVGEAAKQRDALLGNVVKLMQALTERGYKSGPYHMHVTKNNLNVRFQRVDTEEDVYLCLVEGCLNAPTDFNSYCVDHTGDGVKRDLPVAAVSLMDCKPVVHLKPRNSRELEKLIKGAREEQMKKLPVKL